MKIGEVIKVTSRSIAYGYSPDEDNIIVLNLDDYIENNLWRIENKQNGQIPKVVNVLFGDLGTSLRINLYNAIALNL